MLYTFFLWTFPPHFIICHEFNAVPPTLAANIPMCPNLGPAPPWTVFPSAQTAAPGTAVPAFLSLPLTPGKNINR